MRLAKTFVVITCDRGRTSHALERDLGKGLALLHRSIRFGLATLCSGLDLLLLLLTLSLGVHVDILVLLGDGVDLLALGFGG